ncbi:hypothetical protein [Actinocrispum sp. NPDC049592]|uniref:hypothetical protein n=1 Tax=Actinocrispum sp. NPDC049592 TaxID=3154835 RepID=UPI003449C241
MTGSDPGLPRHRTILAVDIEASTTRTNAQRAIVRRAMYDMFEEALGKAGITEQYRDVYDRVEGLLILVQPADDLPKTALLSTFVPALSDLLGKQEGIRLRIALHAGEVHYDKRGAYGEDIDITFRLLDAPEIKRRLRDSAQPLALVVSDEIYRSVIRHGYDGIDDRTFEPLVNVAVKATPYRGWVQVPNTTPTTPPIRRWAPRNQ